MENIVFTICHLTMAACATIVFKTSLSLGLKDSKNKSKAPKRESEAFEILAQKHKAIEMQGYLELSAN